MVLLPSVVIDDLHVIGITVLETEAQTPLIIDASAVLPCSSATQHLHAMGIRKSSRDVAASS